MAKRRCRQLRLELEKICPRCKGAGGEKIDYDSVFDVCVQCGGSGYIATPMGERVIAIMHHNFKPIAMKVGAEILAGR